VPQRYFLVKEKEMLMKRKLIIIAITLALPFLGMEVANADQTTTPAPAVSQTVPPTAGTSQITSPAPTGSDRFTTPSTATAKPSGLIMKWVCKTLTTTVAVSAWIYTVVVTDGITMVVAREIIKYVTVPAIVCDWFF
jgi:hypothetical protein